MDLKKESFTKEVEKNFLEKMLTKIPEENIEHTDFIKIILECIKIWSIWYPEENHSRLTFKEAYNRLTVKSIFSPKKLQYFKANSREFEQ